MQLVLQTAVSTGSKESAMAIPVKSFPDVNLKDSVPANSLLQQRLLWALTFVKYFLIPFTFLPRLALEIKKFCKFQIHIV